MSPNPATVSVQVYCPEHPIPAIPASLTPPAATTLPPVIYHVHCAALPAAGPPVPLSAFLAEHTALPAGLLRELIAFGAVYLRLGAGDANTSPRAPRAALDAALPCGGALYARVHANPKRHLARRAPRVLHDGAGGLLAVDKPAGLPVAPSGDNLHECVAALVGAHVTHRLDVGTCGVVLLARARAAVPAANAAVAAARKTYRALTDSPPPSGALIHWYNRAAARGRGPLQARLLAPAADAPPPDEGNWARAELVVRGVKEVRVGGQKRFESEVRLVTGRTHQIRLQFAACGAAIVGDCKYRPVDDRAADPPGGLALGADAEQIGLCASRLDIEWQGEALSFEAGPAWWDEM